MSFKLPEKRDQLVIAARIAEQCERYDEMLACMKRVVKLSPDLNSEERNLLSVAYKNVIGSRRACWRTISSLEQKEDVKRGAGHQLPLIRAYKKQIEAELADICTDILDLLEKSLLPAASTAEAKVYFLKMKGDYHRYYAEVDSGDTQRNKALDAYTRATEFAGSLKATSPIRLGLALNFSVFYYEILKSPDRGCQLARQAFDEALGDPEVLDEEQHKEAALIMQLLRDNLSLWTEDTHQENVNNDVQMEELE